MGRGFYFYKKSCIMDTTFYVYLVFVFRGFHLMNLFKEEKRSVVYVFIDASNLWQAQKAKGRFFDVLTIKEDVWGRQLQHRKEF